jgi:NAD-dependent dihydropyrimidine dehydrogenase PreA subunit
VPIESLNQELCNGCGICFGICPEDVFRITEDKKAVVMYAEDCIACFMCEFVCPKKCISVTKERAYPLPPPI